MSSDPTTLLPRVLSGAVTSTDVRGLGQRPLATPTSLEEMTGVVRLAREEHWSLLLSGFGSKLGWCPPPMETDLVLSTLGLRGVISYEPGDGTLTAYAGTSMAELATTVAAEGHHLTPDVPRPEVASLGGVVSAGASGVERLACGPVRHNLLGTTVCLADGSRTQSGGQLVKNVTGYDLHRLYCGAHGTLAVVLSASLRLYPLPTAQAALTRSFATRNEALAAARIILDQQVRPRSVSVDRGPTDGGPADRWRLVATLGGRADVVDWAVQRLEEVLESLEVLRGETARTLQRSVRDLEAGPDLATGMDLPTLLLSGLPSRLAPALERIETTTDELGARVLIHPGVAYAVLMFDELAPAARAELEQRLSGSRTAARWRNLGAHAGQPPRALALMQNLKHALDPTGLFGAGRLHGI